MAYVTKGQGIAAIVLGILKLLMGIVIIIIGFVMAGKSDNATLSMYWGGFIYLVPGILGVVSGATKNTCCMITYMILNIIFFILVGVASIMIFVVIAVYGDAIADATRYCSSAGDHRCVCQYQDQTFEFSVSCSAIESVKAVMWGIAVAYLIAGVILLASAILGCVSSCCTSPPPQGFIYQEHPPAMAGQTVVVSSQQTSAIAPPPYGYKPPELPTKTGGAI